MKATASIREIAARWAVHPLAGSPGWWRLHAADRLWLAAAALLLPAIAAVAALVWQLQSSRAAAATQALARIQQEQALAAEQATRAAALRAAQPAPWWARLPPPPHDGRSTAEHLAAEALALAPRLGLAVVRLSMTPAATPEGSPYRTTLVQAELRGPYAELKRWLDELLTRHADALALKGIDWRGAEGGAAAPAIEASIELRLHERRAAPRG